MYFMCLFVRILLFTLYTHCPFVEKKLCRYELKIRSSEFSIILYSICTVKNIKDSEQSKEFIDFTIIYFFLFLCLSTQFRSEEILRSLKLRMVSSSELDAVGTFRRLFSTLFSIGKLHRKN